MPTETSGGDRPRLVVVANHAAFLVSHRLPVILRARESGWRVTAAAAENAVPQDAHAVDMLRSHGVDFVALPISRAGRNPQRELAAYRALHELYTRLQPSVVHHVTIKPVIYGSRAARNTGVPGVLNAVAGLGSVFLDHSMRGRLQRRVVLAMYRRALSHPNMTLLFQNDDDVRTFDSLQLGSVSRRAVIRGSGVDLEMYKATPEPRDGPATVVLPARLLRDKGLVEFVAAATQLRAEGVPARFALVGAEDSNPSAVPARLLARWRAEANVEFWGHRTDMPEVLGSSAVVCLPSYREGLPKALLEAAASGRPVVTTDVPGCRDAVDANSALLVPPRDAAALATALRTLLMDPGLRERMGRAGRRLAEAQFGVDAVATETVALYDQLLRAAA